MDNMEMNDMLNAVVMDFCNGILSWPNVNSVVSNRSDVLMPADIAIGTVIVVERSGWQTPK
jgi:hypothetical protein